MRYFCDNCGASLDPGETCDCQRQPLELEPEARLVTHADWEAAGSFSDAVKPGDFVEMSIVDDFLDSVLPVAMSRGYLQAGEPHSIEYDTKTDKWRNTYATFVRKNGRWQYCGHCFIGETAEPQKGVSA